MKVRRQKAEGRNEASRRSTSALCPLPSTLQRGFTLVELIVVVTIIGILAGVAISNVRWAQTRAREAALRHDLFEMRKAIDDYYADKQKYPDSLATLKQEKYLRNIPKDPITGRPEWEEVQATPDTSGAADPNAMPVDPTALGTTGAPGIADVKSKAPGNGLDGKPYSDY
ncbi:MAG TPA: type II secretion system protein [Thermoanaerobaculia bacterium]|nr:type II secretion system protein [Thermoanaerobaculia bacterium]